MRNPASSGLTQRVKRRTLRKCLIIMRFAYLEAVNYGFWDYPTIEVPSKAAHNEPMIRNLKVWQRKRAASRFVISEATWARVEAKLPFLRFVTPADRARLRQLALEFLSTKEMSGAQGLELRDGIRLAIALQACLPILNLGLDYYEGWIGIVVYPGDFIIPRQQLDEAGVMHEYADVVAGEAWYGGPVLLSWYEEFEAGDNDGANVVIHEFAHKLDMLNGAADGMPPLQPGMNSATWTRIWRSAYEDFCVRLETGEEIALDPYAAGHPAEFFAVASEVFFETPLTLQTAYPLVYQQLKLFYRQDPAANA